MKIKEIENIVPHPGLAKAQDYSTLLVSGEDRIDDIVAFIINDNNAVQRRLMMLRHLDRLLNDEQESYTIDDLEEFMHDQGEVSPEESNEIARDLKLPPYHLQSVDEDEDELPTGEYELCPECSGDGCHYCNDEGLVDVTGEYERPNFD